MKVGDRTLLDHVTWHVGPGDRIGVIGVNGSGKTHLLRLLAGELSPTSGTVKIGQTVQAGHLSQEVAELPGQLRVIEAVQEVRSTATLDGTELSATQLAERFGFANERQWTPVATCPAASGAACNCCGCCSTHRTCCCSTSRPTTWTPTPSRRWRTCSTRGPGRWSSSATTAT